MIHSSDFPNKTFSSKEELFKALVENQKELISIKKSTEKRADAVHSSLFVDKKNATTKSEEITDLTNTTVKAVINTTNILDSHGDVHINGLWKKSLKDNVTFLHLQEHERCFDKVITDSAKGSVKLMKWSDLGFNYEGETEALIFESKIDPNRNTFMYNQYANGWVKNHSVGMRYVNVELAINSEAEWDKKYKATWDKYYPIIANKDTADERGYFWAVTEAKIIEGSAVVMGSNPATPTLENKEEADIIITSKTEPSNDTQQIEKRKLSVI